MSTPDIANLLETVGIGPAGTLIHRVSMLL
jgi:hypothetical protein